MASIDKASRIAAEQAAQAKAEAEKKTRLDPRFPFKIEKFDARFFGLR
jgi:hypothetical protein